MSIFCHCRDVFCSSILFCTFFLHSKGVQQHDHIPNPLHNCKQANLFPVQHGLDSQLNISFVFCCGTMWRSSKQLLLSGATVANTGGWPLTNYLHIHCTVLRLHSDSLNERPGFSQTELLGKLWQNVITLWQSMNLFGSATVSIVLFIFF